MKVTITQRNLDAAQVARENRSEYDVCTDCLVAQAINDVPDLSYASVGYTEGHVTHEGVRKLVKLPKEVADYIVTFDSGTKLPPLPFTFDVELVEE